MGTGVSVGGRAVDVGTAVLVGGGGSGVLVGKTTSGVQVGGIWAMASAVAVAGGTVAPTARVGNSPPCWHAANTINTNKRISHTGRLVIRNFKLNKTFSSNHKLVKLYAYNPIAATSFLRFIYFWVMIVTQHTACFHTNCQQQMTTYLAKGRKK
jgi:hypothetical protein